MNRKDRLTLLSPAMLKNPREYFREYRPRVYLFEGEKGGTIQLKQRENDPKKSS